MNFRWLILMILSTAVSAQTALPEIVVPPKSQEALLFQPVAFGVIATASGPVSYQWSKDGAKVPGATNDQIYLPRADASDAGVYAVTVSSDGESSQAEGGLACDRHWEAILTTRLTLCSRFHKRDAFSSCRRMGK